MKYNCKENDVIIEKKEDEIWIGVDSDTKCGKTVIGLKDLTQALILFGVRVSKLNDFNEEELWCANEYLNSVGVPTEINKQSLSIVGRIKHYQKMTHDDAYLR